MTRTKVERSPRNITKVGHSHVQSVVTNRMTVIFPVTFAKRDYVRSAVIVSGMMTKCYDVIYAVTRLVIPWAMGTNHAQRWSVTFGNPVLGTYAGSIVTAHPRSRRRQRLLLGDKYASDSDSDDEEYDDDDSSESSEDSFSSCSSVESILLNNENNSIELDGNRTNRIAVMVGVPPPPWGFSIIC